MPISVLKKQVAHVAKTVLPVVAVSVLAVTGAHADVPNVTEVVSDGGAREEAGEVIAQLARLVAFRFRHGRFQ